MFKSLSKTEKQWLFIKLTASAYSFRVNYCFSSKCTSSSNISCIQLYLNEYIISTIINFSPFRARKCFVEFFCSILRAESGLFSICSYALFCLVFFSFIIMTKLQYTVSSIFVTLVMQIGQFLQDCHSNSFFLFPATQCQIYFISVLLLLGQSLRKASNQYNFNFDLEINQE